jgi:hypothetical protein
MVEQTLDEMEELLLSRRGGKLTSRIETSYSEEERARLSTAISEMRRANAEMFLALGLEASHYTEDRIMSAKNAHLWTILVDSKSRGMKGFGELPPELAHAVDFHVSRLLELLKELS